jgi:hypothetical protein
MPKFNIGREHLEKRLAPKQSNNSSGNRVAGWVNFFRLADGDSAYVHFIDDIDQIADVSIHRMVKVAQPNPNGGAPKESWTDFVSREKIFDKETNTWVDSFDDGDGTDWPAIMRDEIQHEPQKRITKVLVILEPVFKKGVKTTRLGDVEKLMLTGRYWTNKEGEDIFFPAYQLAFQSEFNFWNALKVHADEVGPINENPFKVIRQGGKTDTTYLFHELNAPVVYQGKNGEPTNDEVDWSNLNMPTLPEILESLGNHERYVKYFGDKSLWRQQAPFARPGADKNEESTTSEPEPSGAKSAFDKLKQKAEVYS